MNIVMKTEEKYNPLPDSLARFQRNDSLLSRKLLSYLPFMILTNLSTLLLSSVDGLVVGNLVGSSALSSVSIFRPVAIVISIVSVFIATGISTALSTRMGENRIDELAALKKSARLILIVSALAVAAIEFPVAAVLIHSYQLSAEMEDLVWQYGMGVLISMPFGLVSTVCVYENQILGLSKILTLQAAVEGITNLVLDLLFVGVLDMGVAGAGYGTAAANILRCTISILYLCKKTDIFRCKGAKIRKQDIRLILTSGYVETIYMVMMSIQSFFMITLILGMFGETGGVINGVCSFCLSIATVAIQSIQGSARPLAGIYTGARDIVGMRFLIRRSILLMLSFLSLMTIIVLLMPGSFYYLNGVTEVPEYGFLCLGLYSMHFILRGINSIFRLYFATKRENRFSFIVTIAGYAALPVFAYLFSRQYKPLLWLAYGVVEGILLLVHFAHYAFCVIKDKEAESEGADVLYLTVEPQDAVEASQSIRRYAEERGYPKRLAYRAALCMEEMIHYVVDADGSDRVNTQLMIRFSPESCIFTIMDDGRCIMLDEDEETKELITNYSLIRKIATSVSYQYILNLNYSVFEFRDAA